MRRPEVVGRRSGSEHEKRTGGCRHGWQDSAVERTYTRPLLDKLGVRPGARVAILDVEDPSFRGLLASRTSDVTDGQPKPDTDLIFVAADSIDELLPLRELRGSIVPNGAIWVVSRKGKAARIRDTDVMAAARSAGLVDNKVVSFSDTHTTIRLVIPRADRQA
ncbi:MAG: DUF3052 family protein [Chloroflexi bacterium]|nr:MAG: DUF3052 family protein [Chloroflexota bacterium]